MQEKEYKILSRCNTSFAVDLCRKLWNDSDNMIISPFSIATIAALMYAGSRENTRQQIARVMHLEFEEKELHAAFAVLNMFVNKPWARRNDLSAANAICIRGGRHLSQDFRTLVAAHYESCVLEEKEGQSADVTKREINDWVANKTKGMIVDLLEELDQMTLFVLVSAICFQDDWRNAFKKEDTKYEIFHLGSNRETEVPMMRQGGMFRYAESKDLKVLDLPYKNGNTSLQIFLPKAVDGIKKLVASMDAESLMRWEDRLETRPVKVAVPRLKMQTSLELSSALSALGMVDAFNPARADFSGLSDQSSGMYISAIIHKALIDIDEAGTKAAAATATILLTGTGRRKELPPVEFRADRPFIFAIVDSTTKSFLFFGRVNNPLYDAGKATKAG